MDDKLSWFLSVDTRRAMRQIIGERTEFQVTSGHVVVCPPNLPVYPQSYMHKPFNRDYAATLAIAVKRWFWAPLFQSLTT